MVHLVESEAYYYEASMVGMDVWMSLERRGLGVRLSIYTVADQASLSIPFP